MVWYRSIDFSSITAYILHTLTMLNVYHNAISLLCVFLVVYVAKIVIQNKYKIYKTSSRLDKRCQYFSVFHTFLPHIWHFIAYVITHMLVRWNIFPSLEYCFKFLKCWIFLWTSKLTNSLFKNKNCSAHCHVCILYFF